jgi:hypothetical protein
MLMDDLFAEIITWGKGRGKSLAKGILICLLILFPVLWAIGELSWVTAAGAVTGGAALWLVLMLVNLATDALARMRWVS